MRQDFLDLICVYSCSLSGMLLICQYRSDDIRLACKVRDEYGCVKETVEQKQKRESQKKGTLAIEAPEMGNIIIHLP